MGTERTRTAGKDTYRRMDSRNSCEVSFAVEVDLKLSGQATLATGYRQSIYSTPSLLRAAIIDRTRTIRSRGEAAARASTRDSLCSSPHAAIPFRQGRFVVGGEQTPAVVFADHCHTGQSLIHLIPQGHVGPCQHREGDFSHVAELALPAIAIEARRPQAPSNQVGKRPAKGRCPAAGP